MIFLSSVAAGLRGFRPVDNQNGTGGALNQVKRHTLKTGGTAMKKTKKKRETRMRVDFGREYGDFLLWNGGIDEPAYFTDRKKAEKQADIFRNQSDAHRACVTATRENN